MPNRSKIAVVIPAYNEAATIRDIAERSLAQGLSVIVVDDGSADGTSTRLTGLPVVSLINEVNAGKAASLRRGMEQALAQGCEAVVTLDGDGQHAPEDIPRLIAAFDDDHNNVVIGARIRRSEDAPRARLFANRFADFWISWAAGMRIRDTQSGFRLYPASLLRKVKPDCRRERGFVVESEMLIEAARAGLGVVAVPIDSVYRPGARPSHFKPVVDITRIVLMVAWKLISRGMYLPGLVRVIFGRARVLED
jgi:glycosyltransferase involved in cell wall biosynthesis